MEADRANQLDIRRITTEKGIIPIPKPDRLTAEQVASLDRLPSSEAYHHFTYRVIARLFPHSTWTASINNASDDAWRASHASSQDPVTREKAYMIFNPFALDPLQMSESGFNVLAKSIGPDIWRMRVVDPRLGDPNCKPIVAGGSCAVETGYLKLANQARILHERFGEDVVPEDAIAQYVDNVINMGPTVTHISGAIGSGGGHAVHYIEDGLWTDRTEAFGVSEAAAKVTALYERINQAVARRAALIDPRNKMYSINFDELALPDAKREWFNQMQLQYDPQFGLADVMYTYIGPQMLYIVQQLLQEIEGDKLPDKIAGTNAILRCKQVDHNTHDSQALSHGYIMGERELVAEELERYHENYAYRTSTEIAKAVREMNGRNPSLVSGFLDLPFGGLIQHYTPPGSVKEGMTAEEIQQVLVDAVNDPRRLNNNSFDAHFAWVESAFDPNYEQRRKELIQRRIQISRDTSPIDRVYREQHGIDTTYRDRLNRDAEVFILSGVDLSIFEQMLGSKGNVVIDQFKIKQARKDKIDALIKERDHYQDDYPEFSGVLSSAIKTASTLEIDYEEVIRERMSQIADRMQKGRDGIDSKRQDQRDQRDEADLNAFYSLIPKLAYFQKGILISLDHNELRLIQKVMSEDKAVIHDASNPNSRINMIRTSIEIGEEAYNQKLLAMQMARPLKEEAKAIGQEINMMPAIFDLTSNPLVIHSFNFLFDEDVRVFLQEIVELGQTYGKISKNKRDKRYDLNSTDTRTNREYYMDTMQDAMRRIYPKIRHYYEYIYGRTNDYPMQRFERTYQPLIVS